MLAEALKDRRSALDLTQDQVAQLAGLSARTVMRAEKGHYVDPMTQKKLCRALGLDYEILGTSDPNLPPETKQTLEAETASSSDSVAAVATPTTPPGFTILETEGVKRPAQFDQLLWAIRNSRSHIDFIAVPNVPAYRRFGKPTGAMLRSRITLAELWKIRFDRDVSFQQLIPTTILAIWCTVVGFGMINRGPIEVLRSSPTWMGPLVIVLGLIAHLVWSTQRTLLRERRRHAMLADELERTVYAFTYDYVYQVIAIGEHVAIKDYQISHRRQVDPIPCGPGLSYEFMSPPDMIRALPDHPRIRHRLNVVAKRKGITLVNTEGRFTQASAP